MIDLDFEEQKYRRAMRMISKDALPEVAAETLNNAAEAVEKQARKNAKRRLTIRRKQSITGIKQDRHARGGDIDRMYARTAVRPPWMEELETSDGTATSGGGKKIPIPTVEARGGNKDQAIKKRFWMNRVGDPSGKGQNVGEAYHGSTRFFIGRLRSQPSTTFGLWFRHSNNKRLQLIYNLQKEEARIPESKTTWFEDAVKKFGTRQFIRAQFLDAAKRRLRRFKDTGS